MVASGRVVPAKNATPNLEMTTSKHATTALRWAAFYRQTGAPKKTQFLTRSWTIRKASISMPTFGIIRCHEPIQMGTRSLSLQRLHAPEQLMSWREIPEMLDMREHPE
jgi:hypothetical protein